MSDHYLNLRNSFIKSSGIDIPSIDNILENYSNKKDSVFPKNIYKSNKLQIQPRGGFATLESQNSLMNCLKESGADFLPLTIDSHTRLEKFDMAQAMLRASLDSGKNLLNGYPLVAHGWKDTRWLIDQYYCPVSLRHGSPNPKVLVEYAIASGLTDIEGGAISYVLPYSVDSNIMASLIAWGHVDSAIAWYAKQGIVLNRESFGPLSATLVPPVIILIVQILELILASKHGVKSFTVSIPELPNHNQTLLMNNALSNIINRLVKTEIISHDMFITHGLHQWMSVFPNNDDFADALISGSAAFAAMAGFNKLITKTKSEYRGIPSETDNAEAVKKCRYIADTVQKIDYLKSNENEQKLLESEVLNIIADFISISKKQSINQDDYFLGLYQEIERLINIGWIDIPFAPHKKKHK